MVQNIKAQKNKKKDTDKYEIPVMETIVLCETDIISTSEGSITCEGIDTPIDCFFDF